MRDVEWPDRRLDVRNAIDALAVLTSSDVDPRPSLTDAVHWLVDDTFWDLRSPAESIGRLLRDRAESDAVAAVIDSLETLLDELGASAPDTAYLDHPQWEYVRTAARAAGHLMTDADGR